MNVSKRKAIRLFLIFFLFSTLLFMIVSAAPSRAYSSSSPRYVIPNKMALMVQNTFRQIAKNLRPAVVTIQTYAKSYRLARPDLPGFYRNYFEYKITPNAPIGIGSGFIIDKRGYIITNYHVIKRSTRILVRLFDGRIFNAKIIGFDDGSDIAVLKISARGLRAIKIGNSDKIEVGDWAIAIGNPSGYSGTFTVGVISAKKRQADITGVFQNYIQTDVSINPGNSGGPLIDISGRVIGVNSWIHSRYGQSAGINFAIPINTVITYLRQIIKTGGVERNGYIGISVRDARRVNLSLEGGYVTGIEKDGPAYYAGIKKGDILIAFNGIPIDSIIKYMQLIINSRVGEVVTLTIKRGAKTIKRKVRVGREPLKKAFLNISVVNLNPSLRRKLSLVSQDVGVVIKRMAANSPMKKAGFKNGDMIFMIDNVIIKNVFEYKIYSLLLANKAWIFVKVKRKGKIIWNTVILKNSQR